MLIDVTFSNRLLKKKPCGVLAIVITSQCTNQISVTHSCQVGYHTSMPRTDKPLVMNVTYGSLKIHDPNFVWD